MHPLKGRKQTPEHIAKRAAHFVGKPKSEETKRKIAESLRGKPSTSSTKFKPGHKLGLKEENTGIQSGYRVVRLQRKKNNGWAFEHTVIAERILARPLQPGEEVHHLDGDKQQNRYSNLLICTGAYHRFVENGLGYIYKRQYFGGRSHEEAISDFHSYFVKSCDSDLSRLSRQGRESRTCPSCGRSFIVGGKGNPGFDTVFCANRECRHQGRIRSATPCLTLSQEDRAHAAELIDTMGTFTLTKSATDSISVKLMIHIGPKREPIRQWLIEHTGLGKTGKFSSWQAYSSSVAELTEQVLPLLKAKHRQAALALETQKRLSDPKLKADRSWQPDCIEQMHKLNAGGRWGTSVLQLSLDTSAASA